MRITLRKDVFQHFHPQFKVAFLVATSIDNKTHLKDSVHLLQEMEKVIRLTFNKETPLNHHLLSPWAIAKQEFGKKARHYHTSVELLLQKILARKNIVAKDTVTNLVRYLSLKHILPVGVDDRRTLKGNLTFALGSRDQKQLRLRKGELYYHDQKGIIGMKLDYWKAPRTALKPSTTSVLLHLEALPPVTAQKLAEVAAEAERLLKTFCNAQTKVLLLDRKKPSQIL